MKKKINRYMTLLVTSAIALTVVILTVVFYRNFEVQVQNDLSVSCSLLADIYNASDSADAEEAVQSAGINNDSIRLTLISEDGTVLYDSDADVSTMENHSGRTEVKEALKNGKGAAVRKSKTLRTNTFYCAEKLGDGRVLRVAIEVKSFWNFFLEAVPASLVLFVVVLILTVSLAHHLTDRLVRPIVDMAGNIESQSYKAPYPEVEPFLSTIRSQHQEIKKTSELRQEFTANVSHELKTPLTSISGYAELMETGIIQPDEVPYYAGQIRASSSRLITLINDIIQLSKLDSPVLEVIFEQVDLYAMADKVVKSMQVNASSRDVSLTLSGTPATICANRGMMEELITNLCDNAIRYNYKGGTVRVSVVSLKDRVILSVQDTGIGISKPDQERIFERFYRVDKSRSKETGGTGLGLSIVKHIVAQHHAEINLDSELGKGTDIRVTFYNGRT